MAAKKDFKKDFESILGRPLFDDDPVELRESVGFSTFFDPQLIESAITTRDIGTTGDASKTCTSYEVLSVSGVNSTGSNGSIEFLLSDFICTTVGYVFKHPSNVVATPRGNTATFLTLTHSIFRVGAASDLRITVFAWNPNGTPAPNIPFDWQCLVPATLVSP